MPRIYVEFAKLRQMESNFRSISIKIENINSNFQRTVKQLDWDIKSKSDINNTANKIGRNLESEIQAIKKYQQFIVDAHSQYARIENISGSYDGLNIENMTGAGAFASASAGWLGYKVSDKNPGITAWGGKASAEAKNDWAYAGVNGYLGKVEAEGKAKAGFMQYNIKDKYKDSDWSQKEKLDWIYAEASAGVSASAAEGDAKAGLGNDILGTEVKADGSLGNATAEAKGTFSVGEDGLNANLKGKALVSAAEGKASASINLLGLEVTGSIGGYAGAAGAEGKVGVEDGKFVIEGGVAALIGFSIGVEIGLNETGWDFITFWD